VLQGALMMAVHVLDAHHHRVAGPSRRVSPGDVQRLVRRPLGQGDRRALADREPGDRFTSMGISFDRSSGLRMPQVPRTSLSILPVRLFEV
jgi:hypothetical protein